jgi:hypothetical protein
LLHVILSFLPPVILNLSFVILSEAKDLKLRCEILRSLRSLRMTEGQRLRMPFAFVFLVIGAWVFEFVIYPLHVATRF